MVLKNTEDVKIYFKNVKDDFRELKKHYPYASLYIYPTMKMTNAIIKVIAANKSLINDLLAIQTDFQGKYSRELLIDIPFDYRENGCQVYGGKWINIDLLDLSERHFFNRRDNGDFHLCVGVPESFKNMENVILESVRTAENMLIAYEARQKGITKKIHLKAYSHGKVGENEYKRDKRKFKPRS